MKELAENPPSPLVDGVGDHLPAVGLVVGVVWLVVALVWKTAAIASIAVMLLVVPGLALTGRTTTELVWATMIAIFVIARHVGNIRRIASGSERSIQ